MTVGVNPVLWLRPEDMALLAVSAAIGAGLATWEAWLDSNQRLGD